MFMDTSVFIVKGNRASVSFIHSRRDMKKMQDSYLKYIFVA